MDLQSTIIMYMEIIGAIAFAISGAMVGIRLGLDLFGVMVLGCCTAVGGGLMRDVILRRMPAVLDNPRYFWIAAFTSMIVFLALYLNRHYLRDLSRRQRRAVDFIMLLTDSIGLAAFTVVGILVTRQLGHEGNYFILVFMGVLTAAGGGLLRDTMAGVTPYIFVKHIYALASILGGIFYIILYESTNEHLAAGLSCLFIVVFRFFAAHFKWNLPRIRGFK